MIASLAGVAGYTIGSADGSAPTVEPAGPDSLAMVDEVCAPLTELAVELRDVGDAGTDAIELLGRVRDAVPAAEQVHVDILIETYTAVADGDVSSLADETTADTATLAATSLMTYFEAACGIDLATG